MIDTILSFCNEVLTTVRDVDTPVDSIQFPSVTVCPADPMHLDRWAFLEELYNKVKFECIGQHDNCTRTEAVREDFNDVLIKIFDDVEGKVESALRDKTFKDLKDIFYNWYPSSFSLMQSPMPLPLRLEVMLTAVCKGEVSAKSRETVRSEIKTLIGKKTFSDIYQEYLVPVLGNTASVYQTTYRNITGCKDELLAWSKFIITAKTIFDVNHPGKLGFGSFLINFVPIIDPTRPFIFGTGSLCVKRSVLTSNCYLKI